MRKPSKNGKRSFREALSMAEAIQEAEKKSDYQIIYFHGGTERLHAPETWKVNACHKLIDAGVQPCGLGCRDTLRFEVGLPLYGDELSADITPIMAGLGIFVKLDKDAFIGKEALAKQKAEDPAKKIVGIELADKRLYGLPLIIPEVINHA